MQSEIREISPVLFEVTVEIPWERIQKDLNDTYREIGKTARIRGFRPGKVPKNVVKQVYGRQVKAQVTGTLVEQGLMQAVQEHELHIVAQPEMEEAPELQQGQPLTFKAKVEVRPKIDKVVTEGIEAWHRPIDVPNEDVDAEVHRLQHQHAEIQVLDPMRPAQEGDLITIDYHVSVDGEDKEQLGAKDRQVEIGDTQLLPALKEGLLGMQPGDEKTIEVAFEDDHSNPDLQGKTAVFTVTAKDLHEKLLPELDDEFAKDCGDYETLLELRLKIREGLERSAKQRVDAEVKEQLVTSLIEHNDIPVPPSMVQQQQQMMMYEMAQLMQMTGQAGAPGEEYFKGLEDRAQRRVQAGILLGSLGRQEGIEVTEADLNAKFQEIADQTGKHVAKVKADYQEAQRDALESQLLEEKVMALLAERANIKEGEPPAPAEPEEPSEEASQEEGEE
ncbi:MAG: trigger factor [Deltaproteobacteria bacterium]|nr:trigger factor [Deltaproteobacteria bacterium]